MLITSFNRPLVLQVKNEFSVLAEEIILKWISKSEFKRNEFYLEKMKENIFPLTYPNLYLISMKWSTPCIIYSNDYKPERYFWLVVNTIESVEDLDNILRLQHRSTLRGETVEDEILVMNQLINREDFITIKTI